MAEQPTNVAGDPFGGRLPSSHERMTGEPWDASYTDGPAPWDIGEPQPAIVRLASKGVFVGAVLDAGCGLGEKGRASNPDIEPKGPKATTPKTSMTNSKPTQ